MNRNKMITAVAVLLVLFMGFQLLGPGYTGDPELNLPERIRTVFQHIIEPFVDDNKDDDQPQQDVADNPDDAAGQPVQLEDENGDQLAVPLDPVSPQDQVDLPEDPAQQQPDNGAELLPDNGAEIPPDNLVDLPPDNQAVPVPDNQGDNQFPIDFFNFN